MATFIKAEQFVEDIAKGVHNLSTGQLKVALTDTAPGAGATTYAALTSPIASTNFSGATPFNVTTTSCEQVSGTLTLVLVDLTLTATGDNGPFRYVALYNDTAASKQIIGSWDYGSSITLHNTETFLVDFAATTISLS